MKIKVVGSTKVGYSLPKEEAVDFSGKAAGICYMPNTVDTLFSENQEKTHKRAMANIKLGHHSVFGHPTYNLVFEGIPKILAMVLNNEKMYNTSEKSARYTRMDSTSEEERILYEKWNWIFYDEIKRYYPYFKDIQAKKLAMENARYLISVFTPATVMEYTVNLCQLNYIVNWTKDYIASADDDAFSMRLKDVFREFLLELPDLEVEGLNSSIKKREFSLFAKRDREEEFGENYSVNYISSFAQLAQAQRHRTLSYEMKLLDTLEYYIPTVILGSSLEPEWKNDISSLKENFPQGMLIQVNERGTIENFVLKCTERLCGAAQQEIMFQTKRTMERYIEAVKDQKELYNYLLPYSKGARCTFPGWKCNSPCVFGGKDALYRIV